MRGSAEALSRFHSERDAICRHRLDLAGKEVRVADEIRDKARAGRFVEIRRGPYLFQAAAA